jgi:Cys-tRNA synthase (O-phospho-L-seryl-tRNA:Cys-tRNA synthase)
MFGGKEKYEEVLKTKKYRYVAMQPLAAGAIVPKEAFEYLVQFDNIVSILFGSSSKAHILETKRIIEELDNNK